MFHKRHVWCTKKSINRSYSYLLHIGQFGLQTSKQPWHPGIQGSLTRLRASGIFRKIMWCQNSSWCESIESLGSLSRFPWNAAVQGDLWRWDRGKIESLTVALCLCILGNTMKKLETQWKKNNVCTDLLKQLKRVTPNAPPPTPSKCNWIAVNFTLKCFETLRVCLSFLLHPD